MVYKINKPFEGHTVISPNSYFHRSPSKNLRHTELEDIDFEKKYDVYTNDEVEARRLITPVFIEKIKNIKTAFDVKKVSCVFYRKKMYLALSTDKDLFKVASINKPLYDKEDFNILVEQVISVLKLVEYFELQEKRTV